MTTITVRQPNPELRKKAKQLRKRQRKIDDATTLLGRLRLQLGSQARSRPLKLVAFDVEAWELDDSRVLEIGLCLCYLPAALAGDPFPASCEKRFDGAGQLKTS